jgi:hypothetical protein
MQVIHKVGLENYVRDALPIHESSFRMPEEPVEEVVEKESEPEEEQVVEEPEPVVD